MDYLLLSVIGLAAGVASGLLGIGGSVVIIPCLALVFPHQPYHQHAAAAMIVNSLACIFATWRHRRAGYVQKPVLKAMIPAAMISICIGVWLSNLPVFTSGHPEYLSKILAVCLAYVVLANVLRLLRQVEEDESVVPDPALSRPLWRRLIPGVVMGIPAGLLGVGGGFIAVPAQQFVLGTRLRNAIANSTNLIIFSAAVGALYKNWTLSGVEGASAAESLRIALMVGPAAVVGSLLGAKAMHVSPLRMLRVVFICYLLWAAYSQWTTKHPAPEPPPATHRQHALAT